MRRLLLLPVLALLGIFLVASPASAATVTDLRVEDASGDPVERPTVGQQVTIAWTVDRLPEGTTALRSTDPSGAPVPGFDTTDTDADAVQVTFGAAGTHTFEVAADDDGAGAGLDTASITVEVDPAADPDPDPEPGPTEVTPTPVTLSAPCTVTVPATAGVTYRISYGDPADFEDDPDFEDFDLEDFSEELPAGDYSLGALATEFSDDDETVYTFATADDGFALAPGAPADFELDVDPDCFRTFVEAEPICEAVTFTNVTDESVVVYSFDEDAEDEDDLTETVLAPGASTTVPAGSELVFYVAGRELDLRDALEEDVIAVDFQFDGVEVEQGCAPSAAKPAHPTVAPAAGVDAA